MVDPGLDNRLRQHTRRSGLAIALAMALTIAICIGAATLIYAGLVPLMSDFVPIEAPAAPDGGDVGNTAGQAPPTQPLPTNPAPTLPAPPASPASAQLVSGTSTPASFSADYQVGTDTVNFRSGPSRDAQILFALPPATPLHFLGDRAPAELPIDEPGWMRFRVEDGTEGWVRAIDTAPYNPNP